MRFPSFRCTPYSHEFPRRNDSGVQATISDKRRSVCNEELGIAFFEAEVLTQTDYYPFGAVMPDRQWSAGAEGYRYGFNGMERDDETYGKGNALDFGARIYDSRLGRWLSVDAYAGSQPNWSPYKSFNDNPISFVDPDGNKEYLVIILEDKNGKTIEFKVQTSMDIMTDGKQYFVPGPSYFGGPTATWSYENRYYDFERRIKIKQNEDDSYVTTESTVILNKGVIRDTDVVLGEGANKGDSKLDKSEWWESLKRGNKQGSGYHWMVSGDGIDPTKAKATKGGVTLVNVDTFLGILGTLSKQPGALPSIKADLGTAEFISLLTDLKQSVRLFIAK